MKKNSFFIFLYLFFSATAVYSEAQTIYLRNGKVLHGEVTNQTQTYIDLELANKEIQRINKTAILRISYKETGVEEKKKVEPPIREKPIETIPPVPVVTDPPKPSKPGTRVVRDPLQRHFLEFYTGAGSGTFAPQSVDFYYKYQNLRSFIDGGTPFLLSSGPKQTSNGAASGGIAYRLKKFSLETGGFLIHSSTTSQNIGPEATPILVSGTYPEELRAAFAKVSYSILAKPNYELYPTAGYIRIWNKTADDKSTVFQDGSVAGKSVFHASENLKGMSAGLGFAYHFGSKWEARMEIESLTLKGTQSIHQQYNAIILTPPYLLFVLPVDHSIQWRASGNHLSLKFTYFWKMGLGFWIGLDSYQWKYTFQKGDFATSTKLDDDPPSLEQALLSNISQNLYASQVGSSGTKATSIQLGVSKAINFGPEENF